MKYLIASDIHGSLPALESVLRQYERARCDMLLLLGDILNYGPRNGLPEGLDPIGVAERLNAMSDDIVAVRGNCDSEVDRMLLRFDIAADSALVVDNGRRLVLTHGHIYGAEHMPPTRCDALLMGHTHLWELRRTGAMTVCNSGSPTFPKQGREATYALYDDGVLSIHTLDGRAIASLTI